MPLSESIINNQSPSRRPTISTIHRTQSPNHPLSSSPALFFASTRRRSTFVEDPLQIDLFFCKTNPISSTPKPMQLPLPQRFTKENHPCPLEENKPNQTQFAQSQNAPKPLPRKALWKIFPPSDHSKTNPIKPNFPPFFGISPSALGNTRLSLRVRISRDRASPEGKSGGAGFSTKGPGLQ